MNESFEPDEVLPIDPASIDPQRLCDAASAIFFAIVRYQAKMTGAPVQIPMHLCPKAPPACPFRFTRTELLEAEAFLIRLGVIEPRSQNDMPLISL